MRNPDVLSSKHAGYRLRRSAVHALCGKSVDELELSATPVTSNN